jgi:hypothetical protein
MSGGGFLAFTGMPRPNMELAVGEVDAFRCFPKKKRQTMRCHASQIETGMRPVQSLRKNQAWRHWS